jgi:hypothetical protein
MADQATPASNINEDVAEAMELVEITRRLFQKNLKEVKEKSSKTKNPKKLQEYEAEAKKLYEDYKKSLGVIEEYIDQIAAPNQ